jgi:hypothetical protein
LKTFVFAEQRKAKISEPPTTQLIFRQDFNFVSQTSENGKEERVGEIQEERQKVKTLKKAQT